MNIYIFQISFCSAPEYARMLDVGIVSPDWTVLLRHPPWFKDFIILSRQISFIGALIIILYHRPRNFAYKLNGICGRFQDL